MLGIEKCPLWYVWILKMSAHPSVATFSMFCLILGVCLIDLQLLPLPGEDRLERTGNCPSQVVCGAPPTQPHLPVIVSFVVVIAMSLCEGEL